MNTPKTSTARVVDISIAARGVVVLQLGTGATIRATEDVAKDLMRRPFSARYVSYDSDAAGNRHNARVAVYNDTPTLRDVIDRGDVERDHVRPLGAARRVD